jgi:CheY-like chemotaxis protein
MARILLVDDEPQIVVLTKMILEKEGHEVIAAKSSAECFEKLEEETPDLILMDVRMPNGNGWEACRKIKGDEKTQGIPVTMFTVRTSEDSIERSFKHAHADAHVNKPFSIGELTSTVERLLGKAESFSPG